MPGHHIAVAGCRRHPGAAATDLHADPDAAPLQRALQDLGAETALLSWDDPAADWGSFAQVVISSTWDSVDHPDEYLAWARWVSTVSKLVNPLVVIEWNLDKVHHRELAAAALPLIPTEWIPPGVGWKPPEWGEFVVKPSVSAGGRSTARYTSGDAVASAHVAELHAAGQTVMGQEYVRSVDGEGETDLTFIAGQFSHAVGKKPLLRPGEAAGERPWEKMAWTGLLEPTGEQRRVAAEAMHAVSARLGLTPPYGRVDLVTGSSGGSLVLEVELIDPYLGLDLQPVAAHHLARALS
ncbi:MAG: ATP-grasp domain-containing protein [Acidimicrobiales bacterium]